MTTINFTLSQLHVLRERSLRNQLLMHLCVRRHQSTALRHTVASAAHVTMGVDLRAAARSQCGAHSVPCRPTPCRA